MAVLSENDRFAIWAEFMRDPEPDEVFALTKGDLRAAFDALDDWLDANAAAANQAIPEPARSALTARQKARILRLVIRRRFEVT